MLYGYQVGDEEVEQLMKLREVTLCYKPDELRLIVQFMLDAASAIEEARARWKGVSLDWHKHAQDNIQGWKQFSPGCDIIIVAPPDFGLET